MTRTTRETVRRIYERRPFPSWPDEWKGATWRLPPVEWIQAVWKRERPIQRILVAGCGTGAEAFSLGRWTPHAEIVAVDYSARSIAVARASQRRSSRTPPISFRVADLSHRRLGRLAGSGFDLVTCHGVLSYADAPGRWLENLAGVLAPDGAVYLGVNGASHDSVRLREALAALGVDVTALTGEARARKALALCDTLRQQDGTRRTAILPATELASDVFGPLIHNLPLAAWTKAAEGAGLHFQSSYGGYHELRHVMEGDAYQVLWPRTHAEAMHIVDALAPESFHRLLFTRHRIPEPPWEDRRAIGRWRPRVGPLFEVTRHGSESITLESQALRTRIALDLTRSASDLLRACDGARTIDQLLAGSGRSESRGLIRLLYGLYQVLALGLTPSWGSSARP